ncbi:predicted protein [Uncinocarpus reesii 1704]|uniref:Uncharacterized protein n=1 Tax=Uncinocarpus reesii (strain UAMH 1704) TaxID=336963 RepID=C4JUM9_UNCRE|nr:uncharacterized protein UREG_04832 [Uncinocarpus reesii 1704]EEP79990.1 predicted protein [Uncinocarpus reesii 1704]
MVATLGLLPRNTVLFKPETLDRRDGYVVESPRRKRARHKRTASFGTQLAIVGAAAVGVYEDLAAAVGEPHKAFDTEVMGEKSPRDRVFSSPTGLLIFCLVSSISFSFGSASIFNSPRINPAAAKFHLEHQGRWHHRLASAKRKFESQSPFAAAIERRRFRLAIDRLVTSSRRERIKASPRIVSRLTNYINLSDGSAWKHFRHDTSNLPTMAAELHSIYTSNPPHVKPRPPAFIDDWLSLYSAMPTTDVPPAPATQSIAAAHRPNVLKRVFDRLCLEYYRYEVTCGVYVMTPGEKLIFNTFILVVLSLLTWALLLYFPSLLYQKLSRLDWLLTGRDGPNANVTIPMSTRTDTTVSFLQAPPRCT